MVGVGFGVSRTAPPQPGQAEAVRCRSLGHPQEAEAPWPKRAPRQGASARSGREKPSSAEGIVKARVESIHRQRRLSATRDRKSTRLNSSHVKISYAVF